MRPLNPKKILLLINAFVIALYFAFVATVFFSNSNNPSPADGFILMGMFFLGVIVAGVLVILNFLLISSSTLFNKSRGKPNTKTAKISLFALGSLIIVCVIYYAIVYFINRPIGQDEALQMIRDCQVSNVSDIGNGEIALLKVDNDSYDAPEQVIAKSSFSVLGQEMEKVQNRCVFEVRSYSGLNPTAEWLSLEQTFRLLSGCKINSVQGNVSAGLNEDVPEPIGQSTSIVLIDYGGDSALIYADEKELIQIDDYMDSIVSDCQIIRNYVL